MRRQSKIILFATTNPGKFHEFYTECADLPFDFVNLNSLQLNTEEPNEPHQTTWENALLKAKFYGKKSGLLTIVEDTGFFVEYLSRAPGVKAKRYAASPADCRRKILDSLKGVPLKKRAAWFETSACLYNPDNDFFAMFRGRIDGYITTVPNGKNFPGMIYDSIFFYPPLKKTFACLTTAEKNLISHRGQVIAQIRNHLLRQYDFKQFIVPLALIIKNKKILALKRRDPRPDFNNKWEFPGGGVENGEEVETCLLREAKEETGYTIKIIERLPKIYTAVRPEALGNYQVFLINYVCNVADGKFGTRDAETADYGWFSLKELYKLDFLQLNKKIITDHSAILKKYLD